MAHAAKLSQLADGLITSIRGETREDTDARQLHDRTLKGLKNASHARTNQFDVQSKLAGLVEKFAVLDRDDLSEGLQTRLEELPTKSKWLPEILSLLLELSDRPVEKTCLEDVEAASKVEAEQPVLTWADIIADDPLDEAGIWDDVERGYHSSDDDFTADGDGSGDDTQATSFTEDDPVMLARVHVTQIDNGGLNDVKNAQDSISAGTNGLDAVSELTLIRETLSMLHGLPTSMFQMNDGAGRITPSEGVKLDTASKSALKHALQVLAEIGSSLNTLRAWTKCNQKTPTLRSCQAALSVELRNLASQLAAIEQRYIIPPDGSVSSIIDLRADIESLARPSLVLAKLLRQHESDSSNTSVALLNRLYDQSCTAQLSGANTTFEVGTRILSAGLNAYLRPVMKWIVAGECDCNDDFFVREADGDCELGRLWHDRYVLRQNGDEKATAPTFLLPFVNRIFALGKGRSFLKALSRDKDEADSDILAQPSLSIPSDCDDLSPFSQVLSEALETWIAEQSRDQTPLLRTAILQDHGLLNTVGALQEIFFSKTGRRFQTFADTLFWRLDNSARWADSFILTELAQASMGSGHSVVAESITVQVTNADESSQAPSETSIRRLRNVQLRYHLPWPLRNVTAFQSSETYSKAFTFLLQTYRAKYLLRQHVFTLRELDTSTTHLPHQLQKALRLHQRLSAIIDVFHVHITLTSSLLSSSLHRALQGAEHIDAMAVIWTTHEKDLEMSLLVAEKLKPVQDAVVTLLELCERLVGALEGLERRQSEEKEDAEDDDAGSENVPVLKKLEQETNSSLSFITAGLRGLSRAGGNAALEQLAERLEWIVK